VFPQPVQEPLPIWVAVGGTPESAVRAGMLGLPIALAIIGGEPARFKPFAELHRRAAEQAGQERPRLSINSHGYIAETKKQALDESFPYVSAAMNRIGQERGWAPMQRPDYDAAATLRGANFVGTPDDVVKKILFQHEIFGHDRFMIQFTIGGLPHKGILRSIELLGREVAPRIREELGNGGTGNRIAEPAGRRDND
jgi:alkanesulfonate monooxygenase SsuD/methylene tetrahydromethanopterin reductase-like flavin-dependent oxidoreductase (luciferase family)